MTVDLATVSDDTWKKAVVEKAYGFVLMSFGYNLDSRTLKLELISWNGSNRLEIKFINCTYVQGKQNDKVFNLLTRSFDDYLGYHLISATIVEGIKEAGVMIGLSKKTQDLFITAWNPDRVLLLI